MELMDVGLAHFSRQVLDGLLDSNVGFAVFDDRFRYRFANEALARLHRIPAEAHEGESLCSIVGEASNRIAPALEVVFDTGKVLPSFELVSKVPTRPGLVYWTGTHFPIRDGRGKLKQVGALVFERGAPKSRAVTTRVLEKMLVNPCHAQESMISCSSVNEHSLTRADSGRAIVGFTEAIVRYGGLPQVLPVILSHREREVLRLLANGNSNKQISAILNISVKTVQFHRSRVFSKLKLDSLAGLVRYAIRHRIVEL